MTQCPKCQAPLAPGARFCAACGAMISVTAAAAEDPLVGKVIRERFRILSVLGEGGMGKVYLAEQKMGNTTRQVAIKVLQPELVSDPQVVARFHRETETVVTLSHPNTIAFYDFGEFEGGLFIAMEFIRGESLAKVLLRGALDPSRIEKILLQVCGSLHEAHEAGIVHRDLKPDNVILTERAGQKDFVKVLDFGIAKRSEAEDKEHAKLTKQGMVLGTPPYMSPEQFTGQALDRRSDVYSLGVMAYEMATVHLPFEANTPWEWATKHMTERPIAIDRFDVAGVTLPRHRAAIMKALEKDREKRQRSALEFAQEFAGVADATGTWAMVASGTGTGTGQRPGVQGHVPPPQVTPAEMQSMTTAPTIAAVPSRSMAPTPQPMPAKRSGGSGRVIAIAVILVVLLGAGAVGAYMVFTGQPTTAGLGTAMPVTSGPLTGLPQTADPGTGLPATADPATADPSTTTPATTAPAVDAGAEAADTGTEQVTKRTKRGKRTEPEPEPPPSTGPTPADVARAQQLAAEGMNLVRTNIDGAIEALRGAQRLVGRDHISIQGLRAAVARRGATRTQTLIQQGSCPEAQTLLRQLRSVGAADRSLEFFGPHCRAR